MQYILFIYLFTPDDGTWTEICSVTSQVEVIDMCILVDFIKIITSLILLWRQP
jgi:hypothetical protein